MDCSSRIHEFNFESNKAFFVCILFFQENPRMFEERPESYEITYNIVWLEFATFFILPLYSCKARESRLAARLVWDEKRPVDEKRWGLTARRGEIFNFDNGLF
jgi:hypothetical protein